MTHSNTETATLPLELPARGIPDRVRRGGLFTIASIFNTALGYGFHALLSRHFSVSEFGEIQSLLALFSLLGIGGMAVATFVLKYSSGFAETRDYAGNRAFFSGTLRRSARYFAVMFLVVLTLTPLLRSYLHLSDYLGLLLVIVAALFSLGTVNFQANLNGWERFDASAATNVSISLTRLVFGFLAASLFVSIHCALGAIVIAEAVGFTLSFFLHRSLLRPKEAATVKPREFVRSPEKDIVPTLVYSGLVLLLSSSDTLLVKNLTSSEMTGHYGALSLLGKPVLLLNLTIGALSLPSAFASGHSGQAVGKRLARVIYALLLLCGALPILVYAWLPEPIIRTLFGAPYLPFSSELWLFGLGALFLSLFQLEANWAYARHNYRICWVLLGSFLLMALGLHWFHGELRAVILTVDSSFFAGYLAAVVLNRGSQWTTTSSS